MNANNVYSELMNQNDRLLGLKNRVRKTVARICGNAPPRSGPIAPAGMVSKSDSNFLDDLTSVANANAELISDISNDLLWLEGTFGTSEALMDSAPTRPLYTSVKDQY
jgi:hypothetical protein